MRITRNLWQPWQPWQKKAFKKLTSPYGLGDFDWDEPYWGETFFSNSRKFKKLIKRAQSKGWIYVKVPYPMMTFPSLLKIGQGFIHYLRRPNSPDLPIFYKTIPIFWRAQFKEEKYLRKGMDILDLIAKGELVSANQLLECIEAEMILDAI